MERTQLAEAVHPKLGWDEATFSRHYAGRVALDTEALSESLWLYAGRAEMPRDEMIVQLSSLRLRLKCLEESLTLFAPA